MQGDIDTVLLNFSPGSLNLLNAILAIVMFSIALDLKPADFRALVQAPKTAADGPVFAIRRPAGRHFPVHPRGRTASLNCTGTDPRRRLSGWKHFQLHNPSRRRQHRAFRLHDGDRYLRSDRTDAIQYRPVGQPLRADAPDPARDRHRSGHGRGDGLPDARAAAVPRHPAQREEARSRRTHPPAVCRSCRC